MGALTEALPKPMLLLEGTPMLEHIVGRLTQARMEEILIVVGFRGEVIVDHFRGRFDGIRFAVQERVEGTAAAVRLGRDFAAREPFLLTFGDIICAASNYSGICETRDRDAAAAVIGVKKVEDPWQGAAVYADAGGAVSKIIEKPARGTSSTNWNSAGLYAFAPVIFEEIEKVEKSPRGEYEITSAVEQLIDGGLPVRMFEMLGAWRDVGRPEDLESVQL
jgi:UDP-N-acetylglucosamine diphosphorylase / glucose-1-phosphate thymidylyltransferase / UDP-N-acetylgalactosamine diphosphorylase / glucosamine-1-phosphate N-acetyltransferase / galactosamine-1-phosphate N-acetyltransferase